MTDTDLQAELREAFELLNRADAIAASADLLGVQNRIDLARNEIKRALVLLAGTSEQLTESEAKFLRSADTEGFAWYVPAQLTMVRRLAQRGLLTIDGRTRYNPLRGSKETLAKVRP